MRLWLFEHADGVNLLSVLGIVALLGAVATGVYYYPLSPVERTTGTITRLGWWEGRTSGHPVADVTVGDRVVELNLPNVNACIVGGSIHLNQQ